MSARHVVCPAAELPPGGRKLVKVGARQIGVFNVDGGVYALLNICPHMGAELCEGPVSGTNAPVDDYKYEFVDEGKILRCARHGWEFDIRTGENVGNPDCRAKTYKAAIEDGNVVVYT
jgi:nitrite reductase/ring-hydroxylating ferredoxin subunit